MSDTTIKSRELSRALAYHGDGLLDLFLGLVLLDGWTVVRGEPGASSGGAVVILFPLLLAAKRAITVPRLLRAEAPSAEPPPRSKALGLVASLVLAAAAVILVLLATGAQLTSTRGGPGRHPWELVALAGLGGVAAAGLRLGAPRFCVYAGLAVVGLVLTERLGAAPAACLVPALAAGMVSWGGLLLARFLATRPRPA